MNPINYKDAVERVLLQFVNRDIACSEELKDIDKKDLIKLVDAIAEDVQYWDFALENKIFIN